MDVRHALPTGEERADAEILLAYVLQCDRIRLLAYPERTLTAAEELAFNTLLSQRRAGRPVAYLVGAREFYGRAFIVSPAVLIPRPSTEALIATTMAFLRTPADTVLEAEPSVVIWAKALRAESPLALVDVGTGSGCIACTLALEARLPVIAIDSSGAALAVAAQNVARHGVGQLVTLANGSLLEPAAAITTPFLVVSNPPYVPGSFPLAGDTLAEPPLALIGGGDDGGDCVRALVRACEAHPACVGWIIECRPEHVTA